MQEILIKAGCYVAVILLGMGLRRIGFFKKEDFSVLSKIVINITLPAVIISSAAGREIDPSLLFLAVLGFGGGVIYMTAGYLHNRKGTKEQQAFDILNIPGYNIGTFALPFTASFLGSTGVLATSLFDVGNAFVCLGGAYGVASAVQEGKGLDMRSVGKALSRSVPFLTHVGVLILNLLHISLPAPVLSCADIIGQGNTFLAMLMIGVGFHLSGEKSQMGHIAKILITRYGIAAILALCYYFLLPFDLTTRQALVILCFSPFGSAIPGFTHQLGGDSGLSSAVSSMAIIISMVIIVTLLIVML